MFLKHSKGGKENESAKTFIIKSDTQSGPDFDYRGLLAVSLGLGLAMFEDNSAVASQLGAISRKIGTNIFVSPAGYEGIPSGNVILDQADINRLKNLEHVVAVQSSLSVAYSGSTPIRPGNPNGASRIQALSVLGLDPSLPNPSLDPTGMNDAKITIVDGTYFAASRHECQRDDRGTGVSTGQ